VFSWHTIKTPKDISEALTAVPRNYAHSRVSNMLSEGLSSAVKGLLIEKEYVEKDYRSVYYNFYAKKANDYRRNCIRIHLFTDRVVFDGERGDLRLLEDEDADEDAFDDALSAHYLGFITLRPTQTDNIGRSIINPLAVRDGVGSVIVAEHKVHVLGHRLKAIGFPWMMQHADISVCAHVACWSILRHYSERYSQHGEVLLHDITKLAQPFDPGGLIPSHGLTVEHAERIFYAAGMFPLLVEREDAGSKAFERQIISYLESGFPVFAIMSAKEHAVALIGVRSTGGRSATGARTVGELIVSDDNHLPYMPISITRANGNCKYSLKDMDAFIVPLPDKIFYPAASVQKVAKAAPELFDELAFPQAKGRSARWYVTTAASLRRNLRKNAGSFDPSLIKAVMEIPMSQFVWVVEYASADQLKRHELAVMLILDATASLTDTEPFWAAFDSNAALLWFGRTSAGDKSVSIPLRSASKPYQRIRSNLKHFDGKDQALSA
jgi:hypothetical protein